ncbi:MAG TPA: hypothetical protein VKR06_06300 [Ktedonosporobacter sp.]|nr:hypothetical protein [Ktedonosporobacter sp.]
MKAVATALVLIVSAAIVLWYGNTLNSWVIGGLIGGLAALLLSIPISLLIFSHLSRRHEDRLREEIEEEVLAQFDAYPDVPLIKEVYDVEGYSLSPVRDVGDEEDVDYRPVLPARHLPAPSTHQRLPIAEPEPFSQRGLAPSRGAYAPLPRPELANVPQVRVKDTSGPRTTSRRLTYPGFPGYEPGSSRSQQQQAALRAARQEAVQQYDDVEETPTHFTRRRPSGRLQPPEQTGQRPSRQLSSRGATRNPSQRLRRTVDASPSRTGIQPALPEANNSLARRQREPQTETLLNNNYPQTGPMMYSPAQTGEMTRHSQLESQPLNPELTTGSLQKPLVRRAPYMYEDDPLRQELAQQLDVPKVRRSSRQLRRQRIEE